MGVSNNPKVTTNDSNADGGGITLLGTTPKTITWSNDGAWNSSENWKLKNIPRINIYPAFEISTLQGHLILVFPSHFLKDKYHKEFRSQFLIYDRKMDDIDKIIQLSQPFGGVSIIPHPEIERKYPFGVKINFIKNNLIGLIDGIEDISSGHGFDENYSKELNIASVGSSDDHFNLTIGTTVTGFDGYRHKNLISALKAKATQAIKIEDSLQDFIAAARMVL